MEVWVCDKCKWHYSKYGEHFCTWRKYHHLEGDKILKWGRMVNIRKIKYCKNKET